MSLLRSLLLLALTALLSACIDVQTVVHVRPDGSGRVEERMLLGAELSALGAQMQMMQGTQGQPADQASESGFPYDRKKLEERASKMGPGVTLASVEPSQDGARQGYRAVFAFNDINKLQMDENPPSPPMGDTEMQAEETHPSLITFKFTPGEPAELVVRNAMKPTAEQDNGKEEASEKVAGKEQESAVKDGENDEEEAKGMMEASQKMPEDPQALAMMQQMFREMRIGMYVEVEGDIVESNAMHREGSRVTLIEMDFGKLMADPKKFQELMAKNPDSMEQMKALLEGVAGVKIDPQDEVKIRFSGVVTQRADNAGNAPTVGAATPPSKP